jgi:hypothetical protein
VSKLARIRRSALMPRSRGWAGQARPRGAGLFDCPSLTVPRSSRAAPGLRSAPCPRSTYGRPLTTSRYRAPARRIQSCRVHAASAAMRDRPDRAVNTIDLQPDQHIRSGAVRRGSPENCASCLRDAEAAGSNPAFPTSTRKKSGSQPRGRPLIHFGGGLGVQAP